MESSLTYLLIAVSSEVSYGASYQKQFGPLPGPILLDALLFMGSCLLLAILAAWLVMGESRAHTRQNKARTGSAGEQTQGEVKTQASKEKREP